MLYDCLIKTQHFAGKIMNYQCIECDLCPIPALANGLINVYDIYVDIEGTPG